MINIKQFRDVYRALHNIDADEIGSPPWWPQFRDDPAAYLNKCPDHPAALIWNAVNIKLNERKSP